MLRFIHAADIHLDSPMRNLERYPGAPVEAMRGATRRAFDNLVGLALVEQVDFVCIAGDVYDGDWKDFNTGLYFLQGMNRLREAGIRVYLTRGNHDAASAITSHLRLPDNVHLFASKTAQSIEHTHGVRLHGQSFGKEAVTSNLAQGFPDPAPGCVNIGLLHTSLGGSEGHAPYAPCTSAQLQDKGYDYWALGHVHTRQEVAPGIVFPGNTQGRHIRETGPKGCVLVEMDERHACRLAFKPLDVARWERCVIDATGLATPDELFPLLEAALGPLVEANPEMPLAVRVEIHGACGAHQGFLSRETHWRNEVRGAAMETRGEGLWVEKVQFLTSHPQDDPGTAGLDGPLGELAAVMDQARRDARWQEDVLRQLDVLWGKLPGELKTGDWKAPLDPGPWLEQLIERAGLILLQELRGKGEGE